MTNDKNKNKVSVSDVNEFVTRYAETHGGDLPSVRDVIQALDPDATHTRTVTTATSSYTEVVHGTEAEGDELRARTWKQGWQAHRDGLSLDDCPYG